MKTFDADIKELEKYLRQQLIIQSQLNENRVLNGLSMYGVELDKLLSEGIEPEEGEEVEQIYDGITHCNTTLLFELEARDSNNNVSMEEDNIDESKAVICSNSTDCDNIAVSDNTGTVNTNITYYKAFRLKVIIYGDDSKNLAFKLIARFRSEAVRNALYAKGIYVEEVTEQKSVNEYKNESMWLRNDFDINIGIKQEVEQITTESDFNDVDITILK